MLEQQKDIDAVVVATPDHMHAPIAMAALDLGKHVYVQKPLCWSVDEARKLSRKARQTPKAVTQMGNQGHSWDDGRKAVEWVQSGAIGDVTEAHVWTNRPLSYWPQGIPRPEPRRISDNMRWNMNGVMARLANAMGIYSMPDELSWDLFLGCGARPRISPGVSPVQLARLDRLGRRRAERHGRAPDRLSVLGARTRLPDINRNRVDAVRRRRATRSPARPTTSSRRAARSRRSS